MTTAEKFKFLADVYFTQVPETSPKAAEKVPEASPQDEPDDADNMLMTPEETDRAILSAIVSNAS